MKGLAVSLAAVLCLIACTVHAGERVTIAVASDGNDRNAQVSHVAAKAPYFLIFDGNGDLAEALSNPYSDASRGAGRSVVPFLAQKGVDFVVAGRFGENMIRGMEDRGIRYLEFEGGVEAALEKALR
jgi:predicted Fe-Mo cluster-binding NifX family protein